MFDLVTGQESVRDILVSGAREMGLAGTVGLEGSGEGLFAKAMSTSSNGSGARAKTLLGWEPKRVGLCQSMDVFAVKAWMASRS
jgi:hypothetical protein